jgi:hypothetical protein
MYIMYGGMVSPPPIMLGKEPSNLVRVPLSVRCMKNLD